MSAGEWGQRGNKSGHFFPQKTVVTWLCFLWWYLLISTFGVTSVDELGSVLGHQLDHACNNTAHTFQVVELHYMHRVSMWAATPIGWCQLSPTKTSLEDGSAKVLQQFRMHSDLRCRTRAIRGCGAGLTFCYDIAENETVIITMNHIFTTLRKRQGNNLIVPTLFSALMGMQTIFHARHILHNHWHQFKLSIPHFSHSHCNNYIFSFSHRQH